LFDRPDILNANKTSLKQIPVVADDLPRLPSCESKYEDATSDVLTTVLNALQFKGKVSCYSKFNAPWAIRLQPKDYAHFHFFERGQGWVRLEKTGTEVAAVSGDLVIFPHGGAHLLKTIEKRKP
jgi:Cupin